MHVDNDLAEPHDTRMTHAACCAAMLRFWCAYTWVQLELGGYAALQELPHGSHGLLRWLFAALLGDAPLQAGSAAQGLTESICGCLP